MAEKTISIDVFEKYNKPDETKLDELLKKK